ncbi:Aste57867_13362 [Aphanomyces stellatus]|uniref:Metallo-beta-lactamase domain-containing protein 1 n=1 Tax=Aphanomyces stellatus TaxID=120398 RepID=A0A485KXW8_9STRA|nr:hypothetical protein As57867_013312 [Aphanomyces stellatus]VFT90201.1 Aste57867_13362 [Aphanomyces stellatus]
MKVTVLQEGKYAELDDGMFDVACSITLIQFGKFNILFDTGGAWTLPALLDGLGGAGLDATDITHVIGSHGHSDHIGCLSAFPDAVHVVGADLNVRNKYTTLPTGPFVETMRVFRDEFVTGGKFHSWGDVALPLDDVRGHDGFIRLVTTPGHTAHCSSLLLEGPPGSIAFGSASFSRVAIVGDLWDCADDADYYESLSERPEAQAASRATILAWHPDRIVPGHGPPFCPHKGM